MTPTPSVYVVDDEASILDAFRIFLRRQQIPVHTFPSARDFLESYCDHWHGWLFTDVQMQSMTGLELVAELRRRATSLSIVVMTANENIQALRDALKGTAIVLEKPFSADALRQLFRTCSC